MRKLNFNPNFIIAAFSIGLLMFMLFFLVKPVENNCIVQGDPLKNIENVKGTELIWESLSRQFISSVFSY